MNQEREIFEKAVELDDDARMEFLDQACQDDSRLRSAVERLLSEHFTSRDFILRQDAYEQETRDDSQKDSSEIGQMVGPYRLMEQIGRGGMGVVYVAEQSEPVRRRVALKIIKPGMDSREVINRFNAERQALAMMDHQNIAKVFDAGTTEQGRPYFVMELVRGVPITRFCDQKKLGNRARLELFVDVCHAIQHAHQKGIIHRDIKPGNVLVTMHDDKAVVKVIDFGVAKAIHQPLTEGTVYTKFSQMIGTPLYMSPEQAEMSGLDIDTRTDIYSLGVLLYELLTGTTPFDRERMKEVAFDEMRRIIREEDPVSPSLKISSLGDTATSVSELRGTDTRHLTQQVRGDLDWIVMKSLEKDRRRRYETANAFAMDLLRHLHDEPVLASPPSRAYKIRKFIRRNRGGVLAGSLVAAALIAGMIATSIALAVAMQQRERANFQATRASESAAAEKIARTDAEREAKRAREAVDKMLTAVGDERLRNIPLMDQLRRQLLEEALEFNLQLLKDLKTDRAKLEAARAHYRLAGIYSLLERTDEAVNALENAITILDKLTDDQENHEAKFWLAQSHHQLALEWMQGDNLNKARKAVDESIKVFDSLDGPVESGSPKLQLAIAYRTRGNIHDFEGSAAAAEKDYRESLSQFEQLDDSTDSVTKTLELADTRNNLAVLLSGIEKQKEAEAEYNEATSTLRNLLKELPGDRSVRSSFATTLARRAQFLRTIGKLTDCRQLHEEALEVFNQLVKEFPHVPDYRFHRNQQIKGIAISYAIQGHNQPAAKRFEEFLEQAKALSEEFPAVTDYSLANAGAYRNLAVHHINNYRFAESFEPFKASYDIMSRLSKKNPNITSYQIELAETAFNVSVSIRRAKLKEHDPMEWLNRATRIGNELKEAHPRMTIIRHRLGKYYRLRGNIYAEQDQRDLALKDFEEAIQLHRKLVADVPEYEEHHRHLAISIYDRAKLNMNSGFLKEAMVDADESIRLRIENKKNYPRRNDHAFELAMSHELKGRILAKQNDLETAISHFQQCGQICSELIANDSSYFSYRDLYLRSMRYQIESLAQKGDEATLAQLFSKAQDQFKIELKDRKNTKALENGLNIHGEYVLSLLRQRKFDEAAEGYEKMSSFNTGISSESYILAVCAAQAADFVKSLGDLESKAEIISSFQAKVFAHLKKAAEQDQLTAELLQDEAFDSLRDQAEFEAIARSVHGN